MKPFIANFGLRNYLWPDCLPSGTMATMDGKTIHSFWAVDNRQGWQ